MAIKGNYWLDLIEKEKSLKKEIEATIKRLVGKKFQDYADLTSKVKEAVKNQLEQYGVKHRMGLFHLEYDLDLKYDNNFVLTSFDIKFVYLDEDAW